MCHISDGSKKNGNGSIKMKKINRKKRGKIENSIFPLFFWNV